MRLRILFCMTSILLLGGCAETAPPTLPPNHPANPAADAAPLPLLSTTLAIDQATHTGAETVASSVYACKMHPEVNSDAPGQCPKCGMKLVIKGAL